MYWKPLVLALVAVILLAAPAAGCTGAAAMSMGFAGLGLPVDLLGADVAYWAACDLDQTIPCIGFTDSVPIRSPFKNNYDDVFFAIIPLGGHNVGVGRLVFDDKPCIVLAAPLGRLLGLNWGGSLWIFDTPPKNSLPIWGALTCSYSSGPLIVRAKINGGYRIGASYQVNALTVSSEIYYMTGRNQPWDIRTGIEYRISNWAFRVGNDYFYGGGHRTMGIGYKTNSLSFDIGYCQLLYPSITITLIF